MFFKISFRLDEEIHPSFRNYNFTHCTRFRSSCSHLDFSLLFLLVILSLIILFDRSFRLRVCVSHDQARLFFHWTMFFERVGIHIGIYALFKNSLFGILSIHFSLKVFCLFFMVLIFQVVVHFSFFVCWCMTEIDVFQGNDDDLESFSMFFDRLGFSIHRAKYHCFPLLSFQFNG